MRPATRKFRRELDEKVGRLNARLRQFEGGKLPAGQNPGFDRLSEALYLKGEWDEARRVGAQAGRYWEGVAEGAKGAALAESTFFLGSAYLFADDVPAARKTFSRGVELYVKAGQAASDDTGYMAAVAGDLRRAEVVFQAATVADMGAQGINDLRIFAERFPDTPRLLKLNFVRGLAKKDVGLLREMQKMERWLTPEAEGITSFRTEEWFYAAHQVVLAQLSRGEAPQFRLYGEGVTPGLVDARA